MSTDGNHHYVPQFHLRNWNGPDQKIIRWTRAPSTGRLSKRRITVASTAYLPGLYSLEHVDPAEVQRIETEVFGQIESNASPVLKKLVEVGPGTLTVKERYWWTRYLQASLLKVPHVVHRMKAEGGRIAREHLSQEDDKDYIAARGSAPEKTLLEWAEKHAPASVANTGLRVLVRILMDERVIDRIIHLHWIVRDVSQSARPLLIGDDPFERIGNLYQPRCLISIPLTPSHVFFGTDAADVVDRISAWSDRKVVNASNISSISTAKRYVYGEAESRFVERYLPKHS